MPKLKPANMNREMSRWGVGPFSLNPLDNVDANSSRLFGKMEHPVEVRIVVFG